MADGGDVVVDVVGAGVAQQCWRRRRVASTIRTGRDRSIDGGTCLGLGVAVAGEVVAFGNSMLFGFNVGVVSNWAGWMLAAIIQYTLVRRAASDLELSDSRVWQRAPAWLQRLPLGHPVFLICGRWLPFGSHLVNTTAGVIPVPFHRHLWCAAVSILPIAVLVASLGSGAVRWWGGTS